LDSQDSLSASLVYKDDKMPKSTVIACRVAQEEKALIGDVCRQKGTTESAMLRALVEAMVEAAGTTTGGAAEPLKRSVRCARLSVRLRGEDLLLLRERARAERVSVSAYGDRLIHTHVQAGLPVPTAELEALRVSIAEMNAIGRRLNELAWALNQGQQRSELSTADLKHLFAALVRLRDRTHALLDANARSWHTDPI
jgi:hypothetical protein